MAGELDPLTPAEAAAETIDALPHGLGELCIIQGASHQVLWNQPEQAHATIKRFTAERVRTAGTAS